MAKLRPIEALLDGATGDLESGARGGGSGGQPVVASKLALFTPNRVRLALSLAVIGRFLTLWYVFHRQASLYAGLEAVPTTALARHIKQSQWDEWRPKQAALHPFRLEVAWGYLAELVVIWLTAPLLALRSKAAQCLLRRWARCEHYELVDNGRIPTPESTLKAAVRYACWFLGVSAMGYIQADLLNKWWIAAVAEPLDEYYTNRTSDRIVDFVASAGFDPAAVFVYPDLMNAASGGVLLNPFILIGDGLADKLDTVGEILAVISHELGHWHLWHGAVRLGNVELMLAATFVATYLLRDFSPLYAAFGYTAGDQPRTDHSSRRPVTPWLLTRAQIVAVFVLWPLWIVYTPLSHLLLMQLEHSADAYAARLGYAKHLCTALVRLHEGQPMVLDPLFAAVMSDHPSLADRLEQLGCCGDGGLHG